MWGSGESEKPFLSIARTGSSQRVAIDMFDCKDYACKAVELCK